MVKRKASKRRKVVTIPEEAPASVDRNLELLELLKGFDALIDKVVEFLSTDELAKLLGLVANRGKVKTTTFKMARTKLPSFFGAKWIDFVKGSGFCPTLEDNHCWQFDHVVTPVYRLPPSIHEIMFEEAWHIQDVYRERRVQNSQEARSRIMDPVWCLQSHLFYFSWSLRYPQYLVRIIGLFQGRVIDKLEQDILESDANGVEHEVRLSLHWDLLNQAASLTTVTVLPRSSWLMAFFLSLPKWNVTSPRRTMQHDFSSKFWVCLFFFFPWRSCHLIGVHHVW